ncbi:hypothetical protein OVA21_00395 [Dietzia sp. SL131]|jgi:hypothetical protein|uniref:hypothetical protein n=1 Tax=unclassified Dietzia TaxID=2617939 RepID=UPI002230A2A5|nr:MULTISPECIES: hypothetical protein [unclassified Dietzia]MCY1655703.1 hypothetical protein [Dietzia sp. SL131]GLB65117.1 hypothetical protein NCCP2495_29970 [Dietzia sp. NCCP-2495]
MGTLKRFAAAALVVVTATACGSDNTDEVAGPDLTSAPEATWSPMAGIAVPRAEQCPEKTEPVEHGYARTPQCAVIAAITGQTLLATTGDAEWPRMANTILAPGPGKDQWIQARALVSVEGRVRNPATFAGFRFTDYSDDRAQVLLAVEWPDGTLTAQPTQLAWQTGDWKLVLPTQQTAVDAAEIDNLDDFTEFRPNS